MHDVRKSLFDLLQTAEAMSSDVSNEVEEILREGLENPLSIGQLRDLLKRVIDAVKSGAEARGDTQTATRIDSEAETLIKHVEAVRARLGDDVPKQRPDTKGSTRLKLRSHDGIKPAPVQPTPIFHERPVAVTEGFVRTRDIQLWDENARLDIHLNQFKNKYGRAPDSDELMGIMKGTMPLPGLDDTDQFAIHSLAKSIATNGVRKPPVIDLDGTLLDGNRRVTACHYILDDEGGEFNAKEKLQAEWLKVWQLTEHATSQDRDAVIVSLNFEPDHKQEWPEYVKAQKVHEYWEVLLSLEPRAPGTARVTELRRGIARHFALATDEVSRYIDMVELAHQFEDYNVTEKKKDTFEVKHRASDKFQYFDELNKGKRAGGVNWSLNQDDSFKHLVFDLLYNNKFRNWQKIRDLKYVYQNEEAVSLLQKARDESDVETAQEKVEDAISLARTSRAEQRQTGANTRIRVFTEWFLKLPLKAFDQKEPDSVTKDNLRLLKDTLRHVETYLDTADEESPSDAT